MKSLFLPFPVQLRATLFVIAFGGVIESSEAATVFSENFDDISIPSDPPGLPLATGTVGNSFTTTATAGTGNTLHARVDSGNLFGAGTSNQYLQVIDASTASNPILRGPTTSISGIGFQLSFDFYDPSDSSDAAMRLVLGDAATATTSRTIDLALGLGALSSFDGTAFISSGSYQQDAKHSVILVGNYSSATINYGSELSQSVAPGTFDIWLDNALVGNDHAFRNPLLTSSTHLGISGNSNGSTAAVSFDNIIFDNEITTQVPEPNTIALLGIASIGCGVLCRRLRPRRLGL